MDAARYELEIRQVVPGYDLLHRLAPTLLRTLLPSSARVLSLGCGPGRELLALGAAGPEWEIDACEPAPAMLAAAREHVALAPRELRDRIRFCSEPAPSYDAALALLVGHLVPDDGERLDFLRRLASSLAPGGYLLCAELTRGEHE